MIAYFSGLLGDSDIVPISGNVSELSTKAWLIKIRQLFRDKEVIGRCSSANIV